MKGAQHGAEGAQQESQHDSVDPGNEIVSKLDELITAIKLSTKTTTQQQQQQQQQQQMNKPHEMKRIEESHEQEEEEEVGLSK